MKITITPETNSRYFKILLKLKEEEKKIPVNSWKGYIPFPKVFMRLCRAFQLKKDEVWQELDILEKFGFIEKIPYHGVKLNFEISENE